MNKILSILFILISISCNAQFYGLNQNTGAPEICQFDISTAVYDDISFYLGTQAIVPKNIEFKPDGSIMYAVDFVSDSIYQYALSTPWDITSATYNNVSFYVGDKSNPPASFRFKPDGTKLYYLGGSDDDLYQYTLLTPWNVSTAVYDNKTIDLTSRDANASDIFFKPDGIKMYYTGFEGFDDSLYQYTLSTAWDISTATYDDIVIHLNSGAANTSGTYITSSGTQLFSIVTSLSVIRQNTISTPWDISTSTYDGITFNGSGQESTGQSIYFKADCSNFFMTGSSSDSIYQYSY